MSQITDGIWIGGHSSLSGQLLADRGIYDVINTAIEFHKERPDLVDWADLRRRGINVTQLDWDDTLAFQIHPTRAMETGIKRIQEVVSKGGQILVNCAMGKSRSVSLVVAYFIKYCGFTYEEAVRLCKSRRSVAQPNANFEKQLRQFEAEVRRTSRGSDTLSSRTPTSPLTYSPPLKLPASPSSPAPASPSFWSPSRTRPTGRDWESLTPKKPTESPSYFSGRRLRDEYEYGLSSPRSYSRFDVPRTSLADPIYPPSPVTGRASMPAPYSSSFGLNDHDFLARTLSPSRGRNSLLDKFDRQRGGEYTSRRLSL